MSSLHLSAPPAGGWQESMDPIGTTEEIPDQVRNDIVTSERGEKRLCAKITPKPSKIGEITMSNPPFTEGQLTSYLQVAVVRKQLLRVLSQQETDRVMSELEKETVTVPLHLAKDLKDLFEFLELAWTDELEESMESLKTLIEILEASNFRKRKRLPAGKVRKILRAFRSFLISLEADQDLITAAEVLVNEIDYVSQLVKLNRILKNIIINLRAAIKEMKNEFEMQKLEREPEEVSKDEMKRKIEMVLERIVLELKASDKLPEDLNDWRQIEGLPTALRLFILQEILS
ncbi:hypothetical protein A2716_00535 [candidate division WWE3 bacterium RIFCSPHIGHO2_01_FULL_40_23]|uniref:Uncharacterized protein n=1 Tax=candidate division WWE3 bacterium RIFCSPLOWO2_01_FULL_41_18 TaxID=1802625 RepID=A0A1F4VE11_UNCKA|nr:MAG: hypothetical protein A2716_00535 [candidate division WWE3 bacterium RIFCSPHIGHO2_01_FULL_40_23]OGC55481.1 MAG: hypothetical protein A3A78_00805 [candidate division WWE3 bacterium RIFCSPLOWO2_01_FULL_41_18]